MEAPRVQKFGKATKAAQLLEMRQAVPAEAQTRPGPAQTGPGSSVGSNTAEHWPSSYPPGTQQPQSSPDPQEGSLH